MKVECDGKRLMVEAGPGKRQAALDLVAAYFRELQKTRRLLMVTTTAFAIVAAVMVVFAPQGRETLAQFIGATLVILGAGVAGFSNVLVRIPRLEVKLGEEEGSEKTP